MDNIRVYADTSVFGGMFDEEFRQPTEKFFDQIRMERFLLVTSAIVQAEIEPAPLEVRELFETMLPFCEIIDVSENVLSLRDEYLKAEIVSPKYSDDALHVALATVSKCAMIVSWNFKHIVHFDKIASYNSINRLKGFSEIAIFSPLEVIPYENEDL